MRKLISMIFLISFIGLMLVPTSQQFSIRGKYSLSIIDPNHGEKVPLNSVVTIRWMIEPEPVSGKFRAYDVDLPIDEFVELPYYERNISWIMPSIEDIKVIYVYYFEESDVAEAYDFDWFWASPAVTTTTTTTTTTTVPTTTTTIPSAVKGDLNNDGKVDIIDLGILLSSWGRIDRPPADINQDGRVDIIDLGILLSNYGAKSIPVPVLVLKYFPLDSSGTKLNPTITGMDDDLIAIRSKVDRLTQQGIEKLTTGSKYHGYKNPSVPSLSYSVLESKEFLSAMPISPNPIPGSPGIYRPDYMKILNDINICNYVDNRGVRQVWILGYHYGNIAPAESNMAMGTDSQAFWNFPSYGDVSNSEKVNDMPTCKKTYTLYNYNYQRELGELLEDHGHQIEAIFSFVDSSLWFKFRNPYGEPQPTVNHCGWTHSPPNTRHDYDWNNETDVISDCEDWKPDGTGAAKIVDCHTWYGAVCLDNGGIEFKIWWMQNIPGKDNGLTFNGKPLRNWWEFYGDFDKAIQLGKSLA